MTYRCDGKEIRRNAGPVPEKYGRQTTILPLNRPSGLAFLARYAAHRYGNRERQKRGRSKARRTPLEGRKRFRRSDLGQDIDRRGTDVRVVLVLDQLAKQARSLGGLHVARQLGRK